MPAKDPNDDPRFLPSRRELGVMALAATMMPPIVAAAVEPADVRLLDLGPENGALARRAGVWNVVETIWPAPGATPKVIRGQVAERRMIGALLQEVLKASPDPVAAIHRMDYTHFDRVEGRWDYVSMEMRAPVAIMPAWSFDRGEDDAFTVVFAPFAVAGSGLEVAGRMLRMMQLVKRAGPDRDVKQQHFVLADGTGTSWLAHEYAYTRREP